MEIFPYYNGEYISNWSGARLFYNNLFHSREDICEEIKILKTNTDFINNLHSNIIETNETFMIKMLNKDEYIYPIIYRTKSLIRKKRPIEYSIKFLQDYAINHLYSSLIKNIILNEQIKPELRIDAAIHFLYNYWFINCIKADSFKKIIRCVCVDIEAIIVYIVEKEMTIYKTYNTNLPTALLTDKLRRERLAE